MSGNRMKFYKKIAIIEFFFIIILSLLSYCLLFHYPSTSKIILDSMSRITVELNKLWDFIILAITSITGEYSSISEVFNNRELAVLFWIFIVLIYIILSKKIRKSFFKIVRALFVKKLMFWLLGLLIYSCFIIYFLYCVDFWDVSLFKSTIIWFFTVATISSIRAVDKAKDISYFIGIIKDNVKLIILLEFITNLYALSFWLEVIVLFLITSFYMMITLIDVSPEFKEPNYQKIKRFLEVIVLMISIGYLYNSIRLLILNWNSVDIILLSKELVLPILLSISLILFNYIYVIYARYEVMFIRLSFIKTIDDSMRRHLKYRILLLCNFNISKIDNFILRSQIMSYYVKNKSDIKQIIKNFKTNKKMSAESII